MRLITSTPQARATSTTPAPTSDDARLVACWLDPHCVSTVVAAVDSGRPAASHAVRVTLKLCSPTWLTQPPTTWSIGGRVDARALDDRPLDGAEQLGRVDAGQAAAAPPDGRADGIDDDDVNDALGMMREPTAGATRRRRCSSRRSDSPPDEVDRRCALRPRRRRVGVGRDDRPPTSRGRATSSAILDGGVLVRRRRARRRPTPATARPSTSSRYHGRAGEADVAGRRPGGAARRVGAHPPLLRALRARRPSRRPASGRCGARRAGCRRSRAWRRR